MTARINAPHGRGRPLQWSSPCRRWLECTRSNVRASPTSGVTTIRVFRTRVLCSSVCTKAVRGSGSARSILTRSGSTGPASCHPFARRTGMPGSFEGLRLICETSRLFSNPGEMGHRRVPPMYRSASRWCIRCRAGSSTSPDVEVAVLRTSGMLCPSTIRRRVCERVPCVSWVTSLMPWNGSRSRFRHRSGHDDPLAQPCVTGARWRS
jgi:hypothetical protein